MIKCERIDCIAAKRNTEELDATLMQRQRKRGFYHAHFYAWINILICFPWEDTRLTPAGLPSSYTSRNADVAGCTGGAIFPEDYSWRSSIATWFLDLGTPTATKIAFTLHRHFISLLNATVVDVGFNFLFKLPPEEKMYYARSSSPSEIFNSFLPRDWTRVFRVQIPRLLLHYFSLLHVKWEYIVYFDFFI